MCKTILCALKLEGKSVDQRLIYVRACKRSVEKTSLTFTKSFPAQKSRYGELY